MRLYFKMQPNIIISLLALVGSGLCDWPAPGTVAHDSLNPVVDTLGPNGNVIKKFQPLLHIAHGCQPYPAVNKNNQIRYVVFAKGFGLSVILT